MPASGVEITDDVIVAFNRIKQKKDLHWVKFGLDKTGRFIIVQEMLKKKEFEDDFDISKIDELFLPKEDPKDPKDKYPCFYLVINVRLPVDADGREVEKLVFIQWVPDAAKVKHKMLYASSAESIRSKLDGIGAKIEAADISDVTFEAVKDAINSARGK